MVGKRVGRPKKAEPSAGTCGSKKTKPSAAYSTTSKRRKAAVGCESDESDCEGAADVYIVERIVGSRYDKDTNRISEYCVKWRWWDSEHNSWEPVEQLDCELRIKEYHDGLKKQLANKCFNKDTGEQVLPHDNTQSELNTWVSNVNATIRREKGEKGRVYIRDETESGLLPYVTSFTYTTQMVNSIPEEDQPVETKKRTGCDCTHSGCAVKADGVSVAERPKGELQCCIDVHAKLHPGAQNLFVQYSKSGRLMLDPMSSISECNSQCRCAPTCLNRVAQHGRQVDCEIYRTEEYGWAVRPLSHIDAGYFVMELVGEWITIKEAEERCATLKPWHGNCMFALVEGDGQCDYAVDFRHKGNLARFVNHSCSANMTMRAFFVDNPPALPRIGLFALRDIAAREELTLDYFRSGLLPTLFQAQQPRKHLTSLNSNRKRREGDFKKLSSDERAERERQATFLQDAELLAEESERGVPCKCGAPGCKKPLV